MTNKYVTSTANNVILLDDLSFVQYIDDSEIAKRISALAIDIDNDYADKKPVFLVILNGAFVFASDLLRKINLEGEIIFIEAKSYQGLRSSGTVDFEKDKLNVLKGKDVVVIEDIVDSGKTLSEFTKALKAIGINSVEIATLLSKPEARIHPIDPKYVGFEIPDLFVVGYGLDYNNKGRSLPHIFQLRPILK